MYATKSTVMQFRMDAGLKQDAEELFRELGTSFAEALRIFARQCVLTLSLSFSSPFFLSLNLSASQGLKHSGGECSILV